MYLADTNLFLEVGIPALKLEKADMKSLVNNAKQFNLDFDDAYQYVVAERNNLTLVSFDKDFDRTKRGRKTPSEVLQS